MSSLEEWIKANLNQKLTLSQLEDFCGYSARAIHDHFSIKYQLSPKQWVIQQRVMHAYQLLSGGDSRPMSMIAKDCGYLDPSRFARHFQQEYGFTPHQCRKASTVRI